MNGLKKTRLPHILWIVIALCFAASACGGSGGSAGDGSVEENTNDGGTDSDFYASASEEEEVATGQDDSLNSAREPDSLDDFLTNNLFNLSLDPAEQAATFNRQQQLVQELVAECMAKEGFEYIAATQPIDSSLLGEPGDVEYAEKIGFGISTTYNNPELLGVGPGAEEDWVDPNEAVMESLSDSEFRAYNEALHGTPDAGNDSDGVDSVDFGGGGCFDMAFEEVYAFEEIDWLFENTGYQDYLDRLEVDPQMVELDAQWSDCMKERGYEYDDPATFFNTVFADFDDRLSEIVGDRFGGGVFTGLSDEEIRSIEENMSPEALDDLLTQHDQASSVEIDQEALAQLQAEERATAVANAECLAGYFEAAIELYQEYEAQFVRENRAVLEEFRDSR